ncbi:MAG: hypothetical protein ABI768_11670 [Acidobacteriota bacterium]
MRLSRAALVAAAVLAAVFAAAPLRGQETTTLFVPVVLSSSGRNNSFFTSEMVETNKGNRDTTVSYLYTDVTGGGASGSVTNPQALPAGRQRVIPDVIAYLRGLGVPIPASGNAVGTLSATFSNLHAAADAAITVRTTTPVPTDVPTGRAGLVYAGVPPLGLIYPGTTAYLCGLKQNAQDRSNVAVQNAGAPGSGDITLRVTFVPSFGPPSADQTVTLSPGGFRQYALTDLNPPASDGFVRVSFLSGTAPAYTYAVVNDQFNSDGSFIGPVKSGTGAGGNTVIMPTVVETLVYATEVVVTNLAATGLTGVLVFTSASLTAPNNTVSVPISLGPYEQRTYPNFVQSLRTLGVAGIPAGGGTIVGTLSYRAPSGDVSSVFLGGRTLNSGGGGRYGVFTSGVPANAGADNRAAWVYGLRQDGLNRTNLAFVNTGNQDLASIGLHVDFFDGATGLLAGSTNQTVPNLGFLQLNTVLSQFAPTISQGYARVTLTQGNNQFLAYAVLNDGAAPGQRSGDGAVIPMDPFDSIQFTGTWRDTTFSTTGPIAWTFVRERASGLLLTTTTLGGTIFGSPAPPPFTIRGFAPNAGGLVLSDTVPFLGPISATFSTTGVITGSAPNVPSPNASAVTFNGTINGQDLLINLTYTTTLKPSGTSVGTVTLMPAP